MINKSWPIADYMARIMQKNY